MFFAVRSTFVKSASSQTIRAASSGSGNGPDGRAERQRAREEVDAEVEARARGEQILDLGIGLRAAERRVELDERELRDEEAERPRQLAGHDLGDERLRPWPAPRNLRT